MKVELVALTQGVGKLQGKNAQEIISYIARVSSPNNQMNFETAPKLLKYLIKNKHWSPFEQVSLTVEIETSRGIAAQILRHRSMVFQEFSLRYSQAEAFEKYPARRQDNKNRQNSIDDMGIIPKLFFNLSQDLVWTVSHGLYKICLKMGIAKEQARFLLPLNTKTTMFMTGSLRSFLHYIDLRQGNGTQKEHRLIAIECRKLLNEHFPDVVKAMWE